MADHFICTMTMHHPKTVEIAHFERDDAVAPFSIVTFVGSGGNRSSVFLCGPDHQMRARALKAAWDNPQAAIAGTIRAAGSEIAV